MDLSDILNNPLFIPLITVSLTFVLNVIFLYWLRKWQYKREYIMRNVEKTYIPLTAELYEKLEHFNRFVEDPDGLQRHFDKLEEIRNSGLFEFIRNHDKKLFDSLVLFYTQIYPKFEDLHKLQIKTRESIRKTWIQHLESVIKDTKAKEYVGRFVGELFDKATFIFLLNGELEEISKKFNETLVHIIRTYKLYNPYVKVSEDRIMVSRNAKFPTFNVSQDEINNLLKLAQPKIQELLDFFGEIRVELQRDVYNDLIPRLQKYISNPLS